jgi:hypothetical protein
VECAEWLGEVCDEAMMVVAGQINFANANRFAFQVWNELILHQRRWPGSAVRALA